MQILSDDAKTILYCVSRRNFYSKRLNLNFINLVEFSDFNELAPRGVTEWSQIKYGR